MLVNPQWTQILIAGHIFGEKGSALRRQRGKESANYCPLSFLRSCRLTDFPSAYNSILSPSLPKKQNFPCHLLLLTSNQTLVEIINTKGWCTEILA